MDNPVKAIIPNSFGQVLKVFGCLIAVLALADLLGFSGAVLQPVTFIKSKLNKSTTGE